MFFKTLQLYFANEEGAELVRRRLSKRPRFDVHDAFAAVDSDKNGFITRDELK